MSQSSKQLTVQEELDLDRIKHLAGQFRDAIEACDQAHLPSTFLDFPAGACGDATLLLGKYLEQNGFGHFDYVFGAQKGKTHAWLQRADLFVDITADQFADNDQRVIVEYASAWHTLFQEELKYTADFENYNDPMRDRYRAAYSLIEAQLLPS